MLHNDQLYNAVSISTAAIISLPFSIAGKGFFKNKHIIIGDYATAL